MKRIIKRLVYSGISAFLGGVLLNLCLYLWILGEYNQAICFSTNIANAISNHKIDVLFSGYLFTSLTIVIQLWVYLNQQLNTPLFSIPSDVIRKRAHTFGKIDVTKICRKLNALETGIESILWEFDEFNNFYNFENRCLTCDTTATNTMHVCSEIKNAVKIKRRNRITDIANCLIFKKWKLNFLQYNEFFATETRKPSEIIDEDRYYYETQKSELKKKNVNTAQRILILRRSDLLSEMTNNRCDVEDFIRLNTEARRGQKKISLKVITYQNASTPIDVFARFNIDRGLFDFVISKKGSRKTAFAQNINQRYLRSFDSTHEIDILDIEKFLNAFVDLFRTPVSNNTTTEDIRYSGEINSITDIQTFMYQ